MIIPADKSHLHMFVEIYNSATSLFAEELRADATMETFIPQFEQDNNMIELQDGNVGRAFMSYRTCGTYCALTSLYVRKEYQRQGLGMELLCFFEAQIPKGGAAFIKVLKNAPWSIEFYKKNGYMPLIPEMASAASSLGLDEKPWSMILYKEF